MSTSWPRKREYMSSLVNRHKGVPAIIIGGAPCWPKEYNYLAGVWDIAPEAPPILLSANEHGVKKFKCNYIACCDELEAKLRPYRVPIISRHTWSDYRIFDIPLPNSAATAAWAAWIMGTDPIIIIGVECFQGKTYADDPKAESSGKLLSLSEHLARWRRLQKLAPNGQFRVVSGPLTQIFPTYNPKEPPQLPTDEAVLLSNCQGMQVKFLQSTNVGERQYLRGETAEVSRFEERMLFRTGKVAHL